MLAVTKAGATCGDLARAAIAANGGTKPWLPHFYLGHGIGTNAAEMPMIGTDLGQEFDDNFVFPAGMVLVLEPVVWEDGTGGYRSEEIVVITEDGYQSITDYPYAPYGVVLMADEILPDDLALRTGRRERAIAQMEAHDLDILVLGRQANVRYVTGAPQLWVAGTRPFAPICVLVRATGEIHLNSSWDEGIPEEIGHDHLYGLAWNPMTIIEVLKNIDGAATARRVGTDALSPTFGQLLPMAFPNAELVDGEAAMRAARRIKTADEIRALRGALAVAEPGLAAAVSELAPGTTEQALDGVMLEAMAAGGVSTSATQDGAWITSARPLVARRSARPRVAEGDLVAFAAGALADGYVGEVGRTWPVGDVPRCRRAVRSLE